MCGDLTITENVCGTVCKPCACRVDRVKVVLNRTRLYQTALKFWNFNKIVCKSCSNLDKPCLTEYIRAFIRTYSCYIRVYVQLWQYK